ncbi:MAG: oligosaccharide flippase family protein [Phycisphaerales bacterium]
MHSFRGDGLRAKALRGSGWTLGGFGAQQVLRLGSSLILTRLLFPEAFGYMALASVYMTGLEMFSDIGIRPAIIQNKRGDDIGVFSQYRLDDADYPWLCSWFVACVLAYPLSKFYETDILFPLLCVLRPWPRFVDFRRQATPPRTRSLRWVSWRGELFEVKWNRGHDLMGDRLLHGLGSRLRAGSLRLWRV